MPRPTRRALLLLVAACVLASAGCTGAAASSTSPAVRYSLFLARFVVEGGDSQGAIDRLVAAGNGQGIPEGEDGIRMTAESLQERVDRGRAWLADHPPADCYADAHASAGELLTAYERVAVATLRWAEAIGTADVSDAYAELPPVATEASARGAAFQGELDAVRCLD